MKQDPMRRRNFLKTSGLMALSAAATEAISVTPSQRANDKTNAAPSSKHFPYVTAGLPNISRAFRIAAGDIMSNVAPLAAMPSLPVVPLSAKKWEALLAQVVKIAGTREVIPDHPTFLIAGLDYGMYQCDAMMHSWDGAGFLQPEAVTGAMFATLVMEQDGSLRNGDFITGLGWTIGAWNHYLVTGNRPFLKVALAATLKGIEHYERFEFNEELNLFRGPAIFGDGISTYPDFWVKGTKGIGHIRKWPEFHPDKKVAIGLGLPLHALSTNCFNYQAYLLTARMQQELGLPVDQSLLTRAERLKAAINRHFWRADAGLYRYLTDPFGGSDQQEGIGNTAAILFGIASREQADRIFENMHITPQGIPINWPVYPRYATPDGMSFGNHNATIWPIVSGVWAETAALNGRMDKFALELRALADRACRDNQFAELYHPITGAIYGGIQEGMTARSGPSLHTLIAARIGGSGEATPEAVAKLFPPIAGKDGIRLWQSCARNTFGSTAYLRMVLRGLCGLQLETNGISFRPTIPAGFSPVAVYDLPYRGAVLEIHIRGEGRVVRKISINGSATNTVPTTATGKQEVIIEMGN